MNKFEYCLLIAKLGSAGRGTRLITAKGKIRKLDESAGIDKVSLYLNELGNDGWEVCGAFCYTSQTGPVEKCWTLKKKVEIQ